MRTKILAFFVVTGFLILNSCTKDETVAPAKVTYVANVKPLLVGSCTPCHVAGGGNPNKWDNYATAKSKIAAILNRVQREATAVGFMPQGGTKLSASNIATLNQWVTDGLLEN